MHQFFIGNLPKIFDSFFIKTSDKHNVNTRFATRTTFYVPKIRTNYGKFNIRFNGPILWNETDERFKILTLIHSKVNYQCISLICISFTIFWRFCYLVVYLVYFFIVYMFKNYLFCSVFP